MKYRVFLFITFMMWQPVATADILYNDFLTTYYGNDVFIQDWVTQINNGVTNNQRVCLFNCGTGIAVPVGFYAVGSVNKGYGFLPPALPYVTLSINEVELNIFYNALLDAMVSMLGDASAWVHINNLGKISVDYANNVSFVDDATETTQSGIPSGITLIRAWTFDGEACIRLVRESGSACGRSSCWNYDLSLRFKQVGESEFGRPLYINSNVDKPDSKLYLDGFNQGGIQFHLVASQLPVNDNITYCYATTYQW